VPTNERLRTLAPFLRRLGVEPRAARVLGERLAVEARADEQQTVDKMNAQRTLGTLADLLAASKPGREKS